MNKTIQTKKKVSIAMGTQNNVLMDERCTRRSKLTGVGCGFGQEPYDHFTGIQQTNHFVTGCFVIVHFAATVPGEEQRDEKNE